MRAFNSLNVLVKKIFVLESVRFFHRVYSPVFRCRLLRASGHIDVSRAAIWGLKSELLLRLMIAIFLIESEDLGDLSIANLLHLDAILILVYLGSMVSCHGAGATRIRLVVMVSALALDLRCRYDPIINFGLQKHRYL